MAYITESAATTLLASEGLDLPGSIIVPGGLTLADETVTRAQYLERASNRIDALPFYTDRPNTTFPRYTNGVSPTGETCPRDLQFAVARLAYFMMARPVGGQLGELERAQGGDSWQDNSALAPVLAEFPMSVQAVLFKYVKRDYKAEPEPVPFVSRSKARSFTSPETTVAVSGAGLTSQQAASLNKAVQVSQITLTDDDLRFVSADGTDRTITLALLQGGVTPVQVRDKLQTLTGEARLDASAVKDIGDEIDAGDIRNKLQTLTGTDRLPASAISGLTQGGGLTDAQVRDQIAASLVGGTNVSIVSSGSGASRQLRFNVDNRVGIPADEVQDFAKVGNAALVSPTKVGPVLNDPNLSEHITATEVRLSELEGFEDGLRHTETVVAPVIVRIGASDFSQYHITGAMLPTQSVDAEMTITIATEGTHQFTLASFYAKPVVAPATILNAANSIPFILAGNQYYLARLASGQLVIGSDTVGDRNISIILTRIPPQLPRPVLNNKIVATDAHGSIVYRDETSAGETLVVQASLPSITGFSIGDIINGGGDLYELVADSDEANVITGTSALHNVNFYGDTTFEWQAVDPFNMRLNLSKTGVGTSPPARIYGQFSTASGVNAIISLARASGGDTTTTYRYARAAGGAGLEAATGGYTLRLFGTLDANGLSAPLDVHAEARWERLDRDTATGGPQLATEAEATAGTLEDVRSFSPKLMKDAIDALTPRQPGTIGNSILHDGPATGITITAIGSQQVNNFEALSPKFDLDDYDNGEVHAELILTRTAGAPTNLGFGTDGTETTARVTDITFLRALKALTTYVADAALNAGETEVFATVPLYRGTTKVGDIRGRLAKNANNELGYLLTYDPEAHSLTGNITISATLDLSFSPSDAPPPKIWCLLTSSRWLRCRCLRHRLRRTMTETPVWYGT